MSAAIAIQSEAAPASVSATNSSLSPRAIAIFCLMMASVRRALVSTATDVS